jgi:hypothetical protein
MLGWIFNISVISLLVILIFHYAFDFFAPNKQIHLVDLKLQKYKNIIDSMIQKQNENNFKKNYEEDMGISIDENPDLEEELELYVKDTYK